MATELGRAYVQIMPSAKGIKGSIQKELDPESISAGKSAGSNIVSTLKTVIAGAAIGKFIGSALTEGGNLQQSLGGIETLFKENADKVKQYANEAYRTSGLSANGYMESVTSFSASLLQSLGGDTDKAADKANTALIDMSDNANKMGTSMEDIQNAYQGFSRGNYQMLDNLKLGYSGTKTEMERLLADASKLSGVKYDISNLADVYDAIHVIQTELDITGTTAKESAETFSGSLASMKSAFSNVMGNLTLGTDLTPHLQALAQTTATFIFGNFIPMLGNMVTALPGAITTLVKASVPYFLEAGRNMIGNIRNGFTTELPTMWETAKTMLTSTMTYITENLPMFLEKGKEILLNIVSGILQSIPTLITEAGNIVNSFAQFIITNFPVVLVAGKDLLLSLIDGIIENLPAIARAAIRAIAGFIEVFAKNYPEYLKTGWGIIAGLVAGIVARLPEIFAMGGKILSSIVSGIVSVVAGLYNTGTEIMQGLWDKIGEWKDKFFNAGKNIVGSIADGIKSAISTVTSAIGDVVSSVRDYLPFSPAKEGPLKDLNKLDFTIIADGIYAAKKPVMQAMDELTRSTMGGITADMVVAGQYSLGKLGGMGQPTTINDGGVHLHIANLNNSNDRDIHDVARVLEFQKRQNGAGKGILV